MNETILIGEHEQEIRNGLEETLNCMGYQVEAARDANGVMSCLAKANGRISAVLLDLFMQNSEGLDTLREIRSLRHDLPVIIVSDVSCTAKVVEAMKRGATDFLTKPVVAEDLRSALDRAMKPSSKPAAVEAGQPPLFFGQSACMQAIRSLARDIGRSDVPVLIQGETGSGKEVLARELHAQSPRADKVFLKLNCAALPSELLESELFGYERGAFTGAFQKKAGMFELASGGTLMLDEIGDLDFKLQAKLLHVLQDREFQRIGGRETIRVDVRVIAATHQNLEQAIVDRTFREDLYYRLNVVNLQLPALRDRKEDILPLAEVLLRRHSSEKGLILPYNLRAVMVNYHWPGNVRELENIIRRFIVLKDTQTIVREIQTKTLSRNAAPTPLSSIGSSEEFPILQQVTKAKHQAEVEAILAALNSTQWNRKQAAATLHIDYKALLYKIKKLGICLKPAQQV